MLICCLKQVKNFILKFSKTGSFFWGTKLLNLLYTVLMDKVFGKVRVNQTND